MRSDKNPKAALVLTALAPIAMGLAGCWYDIDYDCYGMAAQGTIGVRLVEDATEPTEVYEVFPPDFTLIDPSIPPCGPFDGVAAGQAYVISGIELGRRYIATCRDTVGDLTGGGLDLPTARGDEGVGFGPSASGNPHGVEVVVPNADVGGCHGAWAFSTYPSGLAELAAEREDDTWGPDLLFETTAPHGVAPVHVLRYFETDDGASCPALGAPPGPYACADVFHGYYEPAP